MRQGDLSCQKHAYELQESDDGKDDRREARIVLGIHARSLSAASGFHAIAPAQPLRDCPFIHNNARQRSWMRRLAMPILMFALAAAVTPGPISAQGACEAMGR